MMSVLYKDIDWSEIRHIGFDMDGTLYDEYDFITQPYSKISTLFFHENKAFEYMSNRWLEKGSSYNLVFYEVYDKFELIVKIEKDKFIDTALNVFRKYEPEIKLSKRTKNILDHAKNNYKIFLVTDGNSKLQKKKYHALGLDKYFPLKNVVFTGMHSVEHQKPNIRSLELLDIKPEHSMYFGDREKDEAFALASKMQFKKVYNMIEV